MAAITDVGNLFDSLTTAKPQIDKATKQYEALSPDIDWIIENKVSLIISLSMLIFFSAFFGSYIGKKQS